MRNIIIDIDEPGNLSSKDKGEIGDITKDTEVRRGEMPQA